MNKLSHWDYCQFLLVSQTNYTQTYFAEHSDQLSHDGINRLMKTSKLTPQELRQLVRKELVLSENGYILLDDTVIDKNHSFAIEVVRRQWSGNAKEVIKGIGVVTCATSTEKAYCLCHAGLGLAQSSRPTDPCQCLPNQAGFAQQLHA